MEFQVLQGRCGILCTPHACECEYFCRFEVRAVRKRNNDNALFHTIIARFFFFFSFLVVFDQQNKWKKKKRIVIICNYCIRYSSGSSYCRCVLITYSRIRATSSTNRLWFFSSSFLVFKRFCLFDLYLFLHFGSVSSRILLAINWVHCFTMLRQNKIPRICDRVSVRAQQVRARTITFALIKC